MKKTLIFSLLITLVFLSGIFIGRKFMGNGNSEEEQVFAIVNGTEIKSSEVMPKIKTDLEQLEENKYEIKKRAVLELIAVKFNISSQNTTLQNDDWKKNEISKEELRQFLTIRNLKDKKFTQLEMDNIINNMKYQKSVDVKKKKDAENFEKLKISWKIPLPPVKQVKIATDKLEFKGPKEAPVEIVFISNLHCPTCMLAEKKLSQLIDLYKDQLRVSYTFTMQEAPDSIIQLTAEAAMCAKAQNKFWNFHDAALAVPPIDSKISLLDLGKKSGLDFEAYKSCVEGRSNKTVIENEIEQAKKWELEKAPTFVINGNVMSGLSSIEHLTRLIDSL